MTSEDLEAKIWDNFRTTGTKAFGASAAEELGRKAEFVVNKIARKFPGEVTAGVVARVVGDVILIAGIYPNGNSGAAKMAETIIYKAGQVVRGELERKYGSAKPALVLV